MPLVTTPQTAKSTLDHDNGVTTTITLWCPTCQRAIGKHQGARGSHYWWTAAEYASCPNLVQCPSCDGQFFKPASPFPAISMEVTTQQ